jgi:hypothetical protein
LQRQSADLASQGLSEAELATEQKALLDQAENLEREMSGLEKQELKAAEQGRKPAGSEEVPAPEQNAGFPPDSARAKVPNDWGEGQLNKKGTGQRWTDPSNPGNGIRIDEGNPKSALPSQQGDHVVVRSNGQILGPDGKPIIGPLAANPQAHIPLADWLRWTAWNKP